MFAPISYLWRESEYVKMAAAFHSASQSKEGKFVLVLPSIRFSRNFYQIFGTKYEKKTWTTLERRQACHVWPFLVQNEPFSDHPQSYIKKWTFFAILLP